METFNNLMKSKNNIIETLITNVNLNPEKPHHHNFYYDDMNSSYGEIYENNKWIKIKIDQLLIDLIESKISDLNDYLDNMYNYLNKKTINKIKETIDNMDYTKPDAIKKLGTYLKPLLYNNKDMIMETRNSIKDQEILKEKIKEEK